MKRSNLIGYFIGILMPIISLNSVWGRTNDSQGEPYSDSNLVSIESESNTSLVYKVERGKYISFDASDSFDPDGDSILCYWVFNEEISTYDGELVLGNQENFKLEFELPSDLDQDTLVFSLQIQDDSESKLSQVKQIILYTEAILNYDLTIEDGAGSGSYPAGDTVWIVGDIADATFKEWSGDTEFIDDPYSYITYLVMPESNISLTANYQDDTKSGEIDTDTNILMYSIEDSGDDAEELNDGSVTIYNENLELVSNDLKSVGNNAVGLIFRNITIPEGKSVSGAFIRFTVDETSDNSNNMIINGILEGNSRPFVEWENDITSRELTQTSIEWKPFSWTQEGKYEYTTDLSDILEEVISQNNWEQGNAVSFVFSGDGRQIAKSFDGATNEEERPTLVLKLADKETTNATGIDENEVNTFVIYPNPANNILNIEMNGEIAGISITDITGRTLINSINYETSIDLSSLTRGNYIVFVTTVEGKTFSEKFIKL